ncbi:M14 family zinc carboxypeptidase [Methylomonas sp. HW2-6]|uniref:M14 family zinc carboxypeptidase n=1 Tax=Methylomonas sp. HW2-6 TaxID=3376687 RepID=UPI004040F0BC
MKQRPFPELEQLETIVARLGSRAQCEVVETVEHAGRRFPIHCLTIGSTAPDVPVLAYFGGVHGLEKIGSEVILAYLHTLCELLDWDEELNQRLSKARLVFMPLVNPVGVFRGTRCNGRGVDLMRNSPIESDGNTRLYSGQRLSPKLPWYRGDESKMEKEAQALCRVVHRHLFDAPLAIAVDLHSGFGIHDRLWFPYASRQTPFPDLADAYALKQLFDRCYPHHFYKIEPMSQEYVISGDLWDYLYDDFTDRYRQRKLFLPLTLEMGSWLWLRKSPTHLFQRHGLFHPLLPHRQQRILRRHLTLFDFLFRCLLYPNRWAKFDESQRELNQSQALELWYGQPPH